MNQQRSRQQHMNYNEYIQNQSNSTLNNQGGMQQYSISSEKHPKIRQYNENNGNLNTISNHLNRENSGSYTNNLDSIENKMVSSHSHF